MKTLRRSIAVSVLAASLAGLIGCGAGPTTPKKPDPQRYTDERPPLTAPMAPTTVDPQVQQLLAQVAQTYDQTKSVDAKLMVFSKKGAKQVTNRVNFKFHKPLYTMLDIHHSSNPKLIGTKLIWRGNDKVELKTKFIGFPIQVTLDLKDERLKDTRGNAMDELTVPPLMEVLLDPQASPRLMGETTFKGRPVVTVEVKSAKSLSGLERDVFTIDKQTHMPLTRVGYERGEPVYRIQMEDVKLNTTTIGDFKL